MQKSTIIIIGAGLSGLTTAYELHKKGIDFLILEARQRWGGRIHTLVSERGTTMEMGATWFGKKHKHLHQLLDELSLEYFPQHNEGIALFETMSFTPPQAFEIPPSEEPSYRIKGGSYRVIEKLVRTIGAEHIKTNVVVSSIFDESYHIIMKDSDGNEYKARQVISTLPPALFVDRISCAPKLPESLISVAGKTQTWMADSIKFAVEYERPFWREAGFAGTVFSQSSISPELYDHCNAENTCYALKGFLNGMGNALDSSQRKAKVLEQLTKMFGSQANEYLTYHDRIWAGEDFTFIPYEHFVLPHQNNGHALFQQTYLNGKLWLSGTETSPIFGGYMEGAVYSGQQTAQRIMKG